MPPLLEAGETLVDAGLQGFGWPATLAWWVSPMEVLGRSTILSLAAGVAGVCALLDCLHGSQ
jgi:hypothetical protein